MWHFKVLLQDTNRISSKEWIPSQPCERHIVLYVKKRILHRVFSIHARIVVVHCALMCWMTSTKQKLSWQKVQRALLHTGVVGIARKTYQTSYTLVGFMAVHRKRQKRKKRSFKAQK